MKKVAIVFICVFLSISNTLYGMESESKTEEATPLTTTVRSPAALESNSDEDYLKFLQSSQTQWKIAGYVFGVAENILDAIAYGGVMFSQILPESSRTSFTYAMAALSTGKLVFIKLNEVASSTVKERADEIAELKNKN